MKSERALSRWFPLSAQSTRARAAIVVCLCALAPLACDKKSLEQRSEDARGAPPAGGLTQEQASRVLARVGDRVITLGDFAAALERMNEFDRMRYQAPDRRKELLNDMIDLELLAQEAEREGIPSHPEVQESVRQLLRNAVIEEAHKSLPPPAEIPAEEVKAYYQAHLTDYQEPERRRVQVIVLKSQEEATKLLPDAKKASAMDWGKLVQKLDPELAKPGPIKKPVETLGDLGIVGPPSDPKGDNPSVPLAVRSAVFTLPATVGAVYDGVVQDGGKFYLVRLEGVTAAHERSLAEADRSIRVLLLEQRMEARDKEIEAELERQFPVTIDSAELAKIPLTPVLAASLSPSSLASAGPSARPPSPPPLPPQRP